MLKIFVLDDSDIILFIHGRGIKKTGNYNHDDSVVNEILNVELKLKTFYLRRQGDSQ